MQIKVGEVYETSFDAIVKVIYIDNHKVVVEEPDCKIVSFCPQYYKANEEKCKKCKICNKSKNRYCIPKSILKRKLSKIERVLFTKF